MTERPVPSRLPSGTGTGTARARSLRIEEPPERRPLLPRRATFTHALDHEVFSCYTTGHSTLPIYTNIHRIRRDIISVVEDYLSLDQLRDMRINVSVVRPLVDKFYEQDDISIVYCLLVNRAQFLNEQSHLHNRQNVNYSRATLCELIATRVLRRFNEDNEGPQNLMVLAHILVAGFEPFQNAPAEIRSEFQHSTFNKTLPALEVAILSESRHFLSSTSCVKVVEAIYIGRIIYTPSIFIDLLPDTYKRRPISLYEPREAPLLNQYRLLVPRTRYILEVIQFAILLGLYLSFMAERDPNIMSNLEICFVIYAMGWVLDQFATILEHGWHVYTQNLWSFLDVTFAAIYWVYLGIRIYGWKFDSLEAGQQALDVLAMGAPVLIPRLAFNILSDNMLFLSLRSMMSDFALLTALACWCFVGFLLSLVWLGNGAFSALTISKWMIYIWFGLDGSGIHYSTEFHKILGPSLMVTFAFLGNTLFLTILVSMLSTTFARIASDSSAEIQFRRAVQTLEGVKGDALFAYQPPFNLLAIFVLVPLKFIVSPRWFHKIHVFCVRLVNLPLLLTIAFAERRMLWSETHGGPPPSEVSRAASRRSSKSGAWFWERWSVTSHSELEAVFEIPPPDSVLAEIAADDPMTRHLIRRQYTPRNGGLNGGHTPPSPVAGQMKKLNRRDSIAPFPGLRAEMRGVLSDSDEVTAITARLETLEESLHRIEALMARLVDGSAGSEIGDQRRETRREAEYSEDGEDGEDEEDEEDERSVGEE